MSTQDIDPATPARPGYVWVEPTDGTPGHWERGRANAPEATAPPADDPSDPRVTTTVEDLQTDEPRPRRRKRKKRDDDDDDDKDDDRDRGRKHRKHKRDRDRDDDDRDEDQTESTPPSAPPPPAAPTPPTSPPAPPPPSPPPPSPTVRDHRGDDSADAPGGVTVGPRVRDHRGTDVGQMVAANLDEFSAIPPPTAPPPAAPPPAAPAPSGGADVRDHRAETPPPIVRDHREPDVVGDEAEIAPLTPDQAAAVEAVPADFVSVMDDWEPPAALAEVDADVDVASFDAEPVQVDHMDDFAPADVDPYPSDPELSEQLD